MQDPPLPDRPPDRRTDSLTDLDVREFLGRQPDLHAVLEHLLHRLQLAQVFRRPEGHDKGRFGRPLRLLSHAANGLTNTNERGDERKGPKYRS